MSKLKKLTFKTLKYGILLSLKEGYLFTRNSFGLIEHPFKTWRAIFREQDRSQTLFLIGLPVYVFIGGLGMIWAGRRLIAAPPGDWGFWTKFGLLVTFFASAAIFFYLGYWLVKVWKVRWK